MTTRSAWQLQDHSKVVEVLAGVCGGEGHLGTPHPHAYHLLLQHSALREADIILLVGARLNWILHFGRPPRFNKNVKSIQIDVCPEELGNNSSGGVLLCGNIKAIIGQVGTRCRVQSAVVCHRPQCAMPH